jgi:hypothetical protein
MASPFQAKVELPCGLGVHPKPIDESDVRTADFVPPHLLAEDDEKRGTDGKLGEVPFRNDTFRDLQAEGRFARFWLEVHNLETCRVTDLRVPGALDEIAALRYDFSVSLLRARDGASRISSLPDLGWGQHADGVSVVWVDGSHETMLESRHTEHAAGLIADQLAHQSPSRRDRS